MTQTSNKIVLKPVFEIGAGALIEVDEAEKNTLVDMDAIHYNGTNWLFFEAERNYVKELIDNMRSTEEILNS